MSHNLDPASFLNPEQLEEYNAVAELINTAFAEDQNQPSEPNHDHDIAIVPNTSVPLNLAITGSQTSSFESRQSAISSFFDNILPPSDPNAVDFLIVGQDDPTRPAYYSSRDLYTVYAGSAETNQGFNVFDFFLPVGGGPPGHWHPWEHEIWHVTDGEIQFTAGNQAGLLESGIPLPPKPNGSFGYTSEELASLGLNLAPESFSLLAPEGTTVFGSRFRPHSYSNLDSTASLSGPNEGGRLLSLTTSGGLDTFFAFLNQENGQGLVTPEERQQEIPIPPFPETAPVIEFGIQTTEQPFFQANVAPIFGYGLDYEPPPSTVPHIIVAPPNASPEFLATLETLDQVEYFNTYAFEERPVETGLFGNLQTVLVDFSESGNEFKYTEMFISPQSNLPTPIVSNKQESFYVKSGTLSVQINGETQTLGPDTFAYVAPGLPFSIANLGSETADVISMSVVPPNETIFGSAEDDTIVPGVPSGADLVLAGDGNDVILASELTSVSNNVVQGGRGNDSIEATKGDTLVGGHGDDVINSGKLNRGGNFLIGQDGNDTLLAGNNDFMFGGTGADEFWITGAGAPPARANIVADFEKGADKIVISISGLVNPGQENYLQDLKLIPEGGRNTAIYLRNQNLVEPGTITAANPQPVPLAIIENIEFFNLNPIEDIEIVF